MNVSSFKRHALSLAPEDGRDSPKRITLVPTLPCKALNEASPRRACMSTMLPSNTRLVRVDRSRNAVELLKECMRSGIRFESGTAEIVAVAHRPGALPEWACYDTLPACEIKDGVAFGDAYLLLTALLDGGHILGEGTVLALGTVAESRHETLTAPKRAFGLFSQGDPRTTFVTRALATHMTARGRVVRTIEAKEVVASGNDRRRRVWPDIPLLVSRH